MVLVKLLLSLVQQGAKLTDRHELTVRFVYINPFLRKVVMIPRKTELCLKMCFVLLELIFDFSS